MPQPPFTKVSLKSPRVQWVNTKSVLVLCVIWELFFKEAKACMNNHNRCIMRECDSNRHHSLKDGLSEQHVKMRHWWIIIFLQFCWYDSFIHGISPVLVKSIYVDKQALWKSTLYTSSPITITTIQMCPIRHHWVSTPIRSLTPESEQSP